MSENFKNFQALVRQMIHMKYQALFSWGKKSSTAALTGTLRVKQVRKMISGNPEELLNNSYFSIITWISRVNFA